MALAFFAIATVIAQWWAQQRLERIAEQAQGRLRRRLLDRQLRVGIRWHQSRSLGEALSQLENHTSALGAWLLGGVPGVLLLVTQLVGTAFALGALVPRLALVALLPVPLAFWLARRLRLRQRQVASAAQLAAAELMASQAEALGAVRTLTIYDAVDRSMRRFDRALERWRAASQARVSASQALGPVGSSTAALLLLGAALLAPSLWSQRGLTAGTAAALCVYLLRAAGPLRSVPGLALAWSAALHASAQTHEVLSAETDPPVPDDPQALPPPEAHGLRFESVQYTYRDARTGVSHRALEAVSFTLGPGERVAILGPSGAGKSTLGMLVPRLFDPDEGALSLGGVPLARLDPRAVRACVGYVEQEVSLFDDTVRANVALGLPLGREDTPEGARAIDRAVRASRVDELLARRGLGLDARVYEHGANLSGGQRKRLALARALAREPSILVIDQLASDLEEALTREVFLAIRAEYSLAILYLGHRVPPGLAPGAVYWLEGGVLRELDPGDPRAAGASA